MFGSGIFGQEFFGEGPAPQAPAVSLAISTSAEAFSNATISSGTTELPQGHGGQFYDAFQSYPQKLTVRVRSSVSASSTAVMGVRIPAVKIPGVTLGVRSQVGAPSSQVRIQERLSVTASSSIQVGSDSTFEETISALEYDRLYADWEDESFAMQIAFELLEV